MNSDNSMPRRSRARLWVLFLLLVGAATTGILSFRGEPESPTTPEGAAELGYRRVSERGVEPVQDRRPSPEILRRSVRTAATKVSELEPPDYETAMFGMELERLRAMATGPDASLAAAAGLIEPLLAARLEARVNALGGDPASSVPPTGEVGAIPAAAAQHPAWSRSLERDGGHHETFLHDARSEFRRLGLPVEWDDYLIVWLMESVDEIDALAAIGSGNGVGGRMAEFPAAVTGADRPATDEALLLAAWLHRQSTIRMLRAQGVPVDGRFEEVLLNAGLGQPLTPYRYLK